MENDKQLFDKIYENTKESVYRYITAKCFDINDIDDIYQNVYLTVYNALTRRDAPIVNEEAFVMLIAKRQLAKYYGLVKRIKSRITFSSPDSGDRFEENADSFSVEDSIIDRSVVENISKIISEKPLITQKIFFMYYYRDMPLGEIADALGITQPTLKRHLYGTLAELRRLYSKEEKP